LKLDQKLRTILIPPFPHLAMLLRRDARTKIPSGCLLSNIAAGGKGVPLRINAHKIAAESPTLLVTVECEITSESHHETLFRGHGKSRGFPLFKESSLLYSPGNETL
jgi:hypothetical protein